MSRAHPWLVISFDVELGEVRGVLRAIEPALVGEIPRSEPAVSRFIGPVLDGDWTPARLHKRGPAWLIDAYFPPVS